MIELIEVLAADEQEQQQALQTLSREWQIDVPRMDSGVTLWWTLVRRLAQHALRHSHQLTEEDARRIAREEIAKIIDKVTQ